MIALQITANDGVADSNTITVYVGVEDVNDSAPMLTKVVAHADWVLAENLAGRTVRKDLRLTDAIVRGLMILPSPSLALMPLTIGIV